MIDRKRKLSWPLVLFVLLITLFFRAYNLTNIYTFNWDQERDALVVNSMIQDKKPALIGPRVVNDGGFFTGPYHYYYLLPFYLLLGGNPFAGAVAAILVELATTMAIFFVCSKIFENKTAFLTSFIYSLSPGVVSWNVMYIPLFSILIFYLCYLILKNNNRIFPLLISLFALGVSIHPSVFSLIIPIVVVYRLSSRKLTLKSLLLVLLIIMVIALPLVIFDLRHDFVNLKSLVNFATVPKTVNSNPFLFLRSFWRAINILILPSGIFLTAERIVIIISSIAGFCLIKDKKLKVLIFSWIMTPFLLLSIYRGDIPEYYYSVSLMLMTVLLGVFLARIVAIKYIPAVVLLVIIFQYVNFPKNVVGAPPLKDKIEVVSYIVNQQEDRQFNVSYDLPLGLNSGYGYIYKYLGKEPIDVPGAHLYSIFIATKPAGEGRIVYRGRILGVIRR